MVYGWEERVENCDGCESTYMHALAATLMQKEEDEEKAKKQGATNVHSMYKYVIFGI